MGVGNSERWKKAARSLHDTRIPEHQDPVSSLEPAWIEGQVVGRGFRG